ncbi:MAG: hypothetical protein U9O06_14575 [Euryarchaeota archaeon]|nr:hypothetical protein [Euryarchaeota archaeon]
MPDNESEDDVSGLLALAAVFAGGASLLSMLSSWYLKIPLLDLSIPLVPVIISVVILLAVVALYLYVKSDILLQQVNFRYKHPRTSITGIIYLIPGITKPHSEYLEKLKK